MGEECGRYDAWLPFAAMILAAVNVAGVLVFGLALGAWLVYELKD